MLNKFRRLLTILCCIPLCSAVKIPDFQISGIDGDVLVNIQHRLTELYQNKSIADEQPDALHMQIEKAMYPYGFFKPRISVAPDHKHVHIIPGPQMRVTSLTLNVTGEGANNPDIKKAISSFPLTVGQPLINQRYEDAKDDISSAAENQGYLHASFEKSEILIDKQQYTAKIILLFNTGHHYYFGQLRFDPTYISPDLLRRYVPFKYGQHYSTQQLLTLNTNLAASGYFSAVNVKPNIQDEQHVPIDVHLQPINRVNYSLGLGYGTDTGPRGLAGLHVVPVNRYGHKFNALVQGSLQENALQAQYLIPGRNPVTDKYSISGGITNLNYSLGNSTYELLSVAQQHVLSNYQRLFSLNGLHERYHYVALDQGKTDKSLLYPKAIFTWNKTTDQLFSPTGYNVTLNGLVANKAVLSQVSIAEATIDAKAAITFDPIRTRLYLHGIQGATQVNNVDQIPLSIAQLLGGASNLKGYDFNSQGPGKIISYGGVELQKETYKKWYLVGFYDIGDVYKPSVRSFKKDIGIGLMWVSPIGPIKVGLAQAIDNHFGRLSGHAPKFVVNMGPDL